MNTQSLVFLTILVYPLMLRLFFALTYILREKSVKRHFKYLWKVNCVLSVICLISLPDISYIFKLPTYWDSFIFLGVSFLGGVLLGVFSYYFVRNLLKINENRKSCFGKKDVKFKIIIFLIVLMISEEIIWRGFTFYYLTSIIEYSIHSSILISSIMVSTWHIKEKRLNKMSLIRFFVHCLNGIVFTALFAYTHSILFSFTAHLAYNLTVLTRCPMSKPFYTYKG